MCGIAGIFDPASAWPRDRLENTARAMAGTIKHRGPDDDGVWAQPGVALASTRLSILDLSASGHMPMTDPATGNVLVHNGEVYNYKELRSDLGLTGLKSDTDTEVILKSYAARGPDCLKSFNGMFAFALWDDRAHRLFLARDRMGIKPLFYAWHEGVLLFASEIKSLLAAGVPARPDRRVIGDYLVNGIYDHSEGTFFEGIKQVPAGFTLVADSGGVKLAPWWDLASDLEAKSASIPDKEIADRFLSLLSDSIKLRLRSDVPIALHLSGGLDSTLMMATINKFHGGQGSLRGFSYYYGEERYDERPHVEELVSKLGWDVEYHRLSSEDVPALTEEAMAFQEQPFPGIITLAKHNLIKQSRRFGAKVILEGQGGDEIGAGYPYVMGSHVLDLAESGRPDLATAETLAFARRQGWPPEQGVALIMNGLSAYANTGRSADGSSAVKNGCLLPEFLKEAKVKTVFPKPFRSHLLNMQYRDLRHTKLPRILRSCDRASMAFGREMRVPFLDYRLVELAFSLPGTAKIRDGVQRHFMREALKTIFPHPLADHPKRAVVDPQREWLKGSLRPWVEDIFSSRSFRERGIFDTDKARKEYAAYCAADANPNSFFIWQWLSVELWFRTFVDGRAWEKAASGSATAPVAN